MSINLLRRIAGEGSEGGIDVDDPRARPVEFRGGNDNGISGLLHGGLKQTELLCRLPVRSRGAIAPGWRGPELFFGRAAWRFCLWLLLHLSPLRNSLRLGLSPRPGHFPTLTHARRRTAVLPQ
jgi:hypothetical protein